MARAYAMPAGNKYLVGSKKNFSTGGSLMYLEDAEKFYSKVVIVKPDAAILAEAMGSEIKANSTLENWKSKY